jgi:hypothetical protein
MEIPMTVQSIPSDTAESNQRLESMRPCRRKEITEKVLMLLAIMPICTFGMGTIALSVILFTVTPLATATPVVAVVVLLLMAAAVAAIAFALGHFWEHATTNTERLVDKCFHADASRLDRIKAIAAVAIEIIAVVLPYCGVGGMYMYSITLFSLLPINYCYFILAAGVVGIAISVFFLISWSIQYFKSHRPPHH